ncbi:hypothetical protein EYF80_019095 [Liparis tanakae]|uniref:Uncharacterized protein n=1 Tax=Liparis tanakae TaxID=230148 RepID=A0A4Z2HYB6_9TELE|nr:hypothetical protein EYF80_019095 [Liparis tanakae]
MADERGQSQSSAVPPSPSDSTDVLSAALVGRVRGARFLPSWALVRRAVVSNRVVGAWTARHKRNTAQSRLDIREEATVGVLGAVRLRKDRRCWLRSENLRMDSLLREARERRELVLLKSPSPSSARPALSTGLDIKPNAP